MTGRLVDYNTSRSSRTSRTIWTSRFKNLSLTFSGVKKHTMVNVPIANNKSRKTKRKLVLYILKMKKDKIG